MPIALNCSRSIKLKEDAASWCKACGKKLMDFKAGDLAFAIERGSCDCSWRCCRAAMPANKPHAPHREVRAIDGRVLAADNTTSSCT